MCRLNELEEKVLIASKMRVNGLIRDRQFEELWKSAVFELINCGNAQAFVRVDRDMRKGVLSRNEYVHSLFDIEFATAQATRAFYANCFLDLMQRCGKTSDPYIWYVKPDYWLSADECFGLYDNPNHYPWNTYGAFYDRVQSQRDREGKLFQGILGDPSKQ